MIIQYASDLHLEFNNNKQFIKLNPLKSAGEVLLLAGDIVPFAVMNKHKDFFSYVSDNFETVYWIPGNHEYYYFDLAEKQGAIHEQIKSNVYLVNNTAIQRNDVNLIFSTLWSHIKPDHEWQIEKAMSDFQVIKYKGHRFSVPIFNGLHKQSADFVKQALQENTAGKQVVVTHHVPTLMHYPEKYKADFLNEAFAVELFDLIEAQQPDYWIYGHHHTNTPAFNIGKTSMLTNQLGYVQQDEHFLFGNAKTITL